MYVAVERGRGGVNFRGVEYSPAGERLMRALGRLWQQTDDEDEKAALQREAGVIHTLHAEFPGLVVHEAQGRDPVADSFGHPSGVRLAGASSEEDEPASRPETLFEDAA